MIIDLIQSMVMCVCMKWHTYVWCVILR